MLPRFEIVARRRPVRLVVPGTTLPPVAPYAAVQATLGGPGPASVSLTSGDTALTAELGDSVALVVSTGTQRTTHRSRRHGRPSGPVDGLAVTLTGPQVTALTREEGVWVARARYDLSERLDTRDERWLAGLSTASSGAIDNVQAGAFGQLGLRDLRLVSNADGTAYRIEPGDPRVLLTATSSGPGHFPTAHTSVWSLDTESYDLEHRADLFFRRPERPGVYGDHASHLVRVDGRWLVATSTWGDFEPPGRPRREASVAVTLAESEADLTSGTHVLDTRPLTLPTPGLRSVGVWDPHLVRTADGWLVGFVSARRFFRFHPALAAGTDLDDLEFRAAAGDRRATEGTTLARVGRDWRVLASDGRDGRRGQRAAFPVFDLDLRQVGTLDAAYPTNLPWPTLVPLGADGRDNGDADWLMVGFNGARYGGPLVGYGSHGAVVIQRTHPT